MGGPSRKKAGKGVTNFAGWLIGVEGEPFRTCRGQAIKGGRPARWPIERNRLA
jgi:hypothetical protein